MTRIAAVALSISLLGAPACVPKSKHQKTVAELDACTASRRDLAAEKKRLRRELEGKLSATEEELAELRRQRQAQAKRLELLRRFTDKLRAMIDVGDIDVSIRRGRMVVGMPSKVLFPSGEHALSERGAATLAKVAAALKDLSERRFIVAGHTDNRPIGKTLKDTYEDNWDLSVRRALVVTRFLIEQGVPPKSLAAAGYGQYDPTASNRRRSGRRKNRRIELIVEPVLAELPPLPDDFDKKPDEEPEKTAK